MTIDLSKLQRLNKDARALLDTLADRLPERDVTNLRTYSYVGELTMLVNGICGALVQDQIPVRATERDALASVLALFEKPVLDGDYINDSETTLASLNVSE